jgi:hypothetical protein
MKLGDWIDHFVLFDSVDYDYKEGTWTLDSFEDEDGLVTDGVQPLMVAVTLGFKILGKYGASINPDIAPP